MCYAQLLLLLRGVVGVGLGGVPVVFTLFTEFCPTAGRGAWLVALQSFWTVGTMAEAALAAEFLVSLGWRWLLGLSAVPFGEPATPWIVGLLVHVYIYSCVSQGCMMGLQHLQPVKSWNGSSSCCYTLT